MIPGMNQRKMQQMMKKMGIAQQEIDATEVIIRTPEKEIFISNPSVVKVNMMGKETLQITGNMEERSLGTKPEINEDDIETVMEAANISREEALNAIELHDGDLAEAILSLKKE